MNRRRFLETLGLGTASLAVPQLARSLFAQSPAPGRRPNIVLILSDDMGFSDLGCYGSEIPTPNLDGLAADGVRFTQFYNTARCCPTRASLLTGLHPHQAGMGHMTGGKAKSDGFAGDLNRRCVTLAEALRPAGYSTYMTGKWHVASTRENWPLQRGFDRYYGIIGGAANYYNPATLTRDNTPITPATDPEYKTDDYHLTDAISDNAVRFLADHAKNTADKPFFLYTAFTAAHWPLHARPDSIARAQGRYDAGYAPIRRARYEKQKRLGLIRPEWELSDAPTDWNSHSPAYQAWEARCMEVYAAMVEDMDRGIGRIVAELKRTGQFDNTLILFLQDNGGCAENLGRAAGKDAPAGSLPPLPGPAETYISYGEAWANVSDTPFRYYKHFVHEGGIATPLIAHWPAGIRRKGVLEDQPGQLVDIMPTLVELAGAKYPARFRDAAIAPMEGCSLVPAFAGKKTGRGPLFWEHEGNRAVRSGQWKLVARGPAGPWELYDLEKDRSEMHNLAAAEPARVKELAAEWEKWARRAGVLPWPWNPAYGEKEVPVGSDKVRFELKPGDSLARADAPRIAGRALAVTASLKTHGADGVIVVQGGTQTGYALYLKEGRLEFAVRQQGNLSKVRTPDPLPAGPVEVAARLQAGGALVLEVGGKQAAGGKCPGLFPAMPVAGLRIGGNPSGFVGDYGKDNAFQGEIEKVVVELGEAK